MIAYITIPEPCHEDWQAMTPNEQGRHCAQCCKTVVDFSGWEPQEILFYLQAHREEQVCGRFRNEHLNTPIPAPDFFIRQLCQTPISIVKKIAAIFLFVFGLMSASCNAPQAPAASIKPDTLQHTTAPQDSSDNTILGGMGVTVLPLDSPVATTIFVPPIIVKEPVDDTEPYVEDRMLSAPSFEGITGGAPVVREVYVGEAAGTDTAATSGLVNVVADSAKK